MNSLPPELLSSIIEIATDCSSIYDSYRARLETLSALALVNHQFHEIAQPLLPRTLYVRKQGEESAFWNHCSYEEAQRLTWEIGVSNLGQSSTQLVDFAKLKELRICDSTLVRLEILGNHKYLEKLSLDKCAFDVGADYGGFVLSSLKELTIERSTALLEGSNLRDHSFFTATRFPSLRALGIKALACMTPSGDIVRTVSAIVSSSLLSQLDCMTADEIEPRSTSSLSPSSPPLPVPVPILFDLDPRHTATSWGRSSLAPNSSLSHSHIRIRLPCEPIPHRRQIEAALFLVETLINESTALEELYLDLYPRDGRRGYELDEELQERIRKLEDPNRKTKVEIIWENHEDDWCRSRVSKEFWRRSKARKKRAEQGEEMSKT